MIELAKHIEYLLLENECVVVPELGGFISHYQSAHYEETEGLYLPPIRTLGFNPQLTMNDGLLVQSYMQAYHTDFPDATRKIQQAVDKMKAQLYSEGVIEMHGIGTLHYNIRGLYEFHPDESGVLSPSLYALDAFRIPLLGTETEPVMEIEEQVEPQKQLTAKKQKEFHLDTRWIGHAVAVVIAAVLFFTLSAPVENTYIDKGNYASLGTDNLFDAIRSHSMATTLDMPAIENPQHIKKQEIKPVAVRMEKIAPVAKAETPKEAAPQPIKENKMKKAENTVKVETIAKTSTPAPPKTKVIPQKKYHLIVASLATSKDAQQVLEGYKQKGYSEVSIIEGSGRFRISLYNFSDRNSANNKLNELKKEEAYKTAWLLTSK